MNSTLRLAFLMALCLGGATAQAESSIGAASASARVNLVVTVPPVFNVLEQQDVPGGVNLRLWTNMPSIVIRGQELRFDRVGEQQVYIPNIATGPGYSIGSDGIITYTQP